MNDDQDRSTDFDEDISAAFEPVRTAPAPELWDRIESAAEDRSKPAPSSASWRQRRTIVAAAAALVVLAGSAVALGTMGRGDRVEVVADSTTVQRSTTTSESTATTVPEAVTPLLAGATWARIDAEAQALVSDIGQSYPLGEVGLGGRIVDRLPGGTVVVATLDGVTAFEADATATVSLWPEAATDLRRNEDGRLIAITDAGPVDLQRAELVADSPIDERQRIDAANGFSVEVVPGEYTTGEDGVVTDVVRPDALRLLVDGEQSDVWPFGGPVEFQVVLDDFNGRYVLAHRRPSEPALPPAEHVVIDLFDGSVDSFLALPGTVALTVADTDERPPSSSTGLLPLCPTMSATVQLTAPSDLDGAAAAAFDQAALAVSRCDEAWLRLVSPTDPLDDDVWERVSASLRTVPTRGDSGWTFGEGTAATVSISTDGVVSIEQHTATFELRITKLDGSIVLAGSVGPDSAAGILAAAEGQAAGGNVWDFGLTVGGGEMEADLRHAVEEMIGTGFGRSPVVEVLVTPTLVRVISQDSFVTDGELVQTLLEQSGVSVEAQLLSAEPTDNERSTIEALQDFAAGGPLDPSIAWSDVVSLGAGSNEGKRLSPTELSDRSNWLIENVPNFRGGDEQPFTALTIVSDPTVVVGPHDHCASPPVPAPPALAGLRRVSLQPDPSTIDSCLQWSTFDVFFDSQGRVAGITIDRWEP